MPKIVNINKDQFEKLCALQCTEVEICEWFGITDKTLCRWCKKIYKKTFSEVFKEKRSKGKVSLRRTQFKLAQKSPAMAIFLGKQYLGQTDKVEQVNTDNDNVLKFIEGMKNNGNKAN
jgi:hypothetical protein